MGNHQGRDEIQQLCVWRIEDVRTALGGRTVALVFESAFKMKWPTNTRDLLFISIK